MKSLDVGCGPGVLPQGWVGMDAHTPDDSGPITRHDMTDIPWPWSDDTFEQVAFRHSLEHVALDQALLVLKEAWRVLRPGGVLQIEVPELESVCRWFLDSDERDRWGAWNQTSPARWLFGQQHGNGQYHLAGFTQQRLRALLGEVGGANGMVMGVPHGYVPIMVLRATMMKPPNAM